MPFSPLKGKIVIYVNGGPGDLPEALKSFARTAPLAKALADAGAGPATKPATLDVDLHFKHLRDFGPDAIVTQVPELNKLRQLREAFKALRSPMASKREFRKTIERIVTDPVLKERLILELKKLGLFEELGMNETSEPGHEG
jgi:hypothetical protein